MLSVFLECKENKTLNIVLAVIMPILLVAVIILIICIIKKKKNRYVNYVQNSEFSGIDVLYDLK